MDVQGHCKQKTMRNDGYVAGHPLLSVSASEMTYIVSGGALNYSLTQLLVGCERLHPTDSRRCYYPLVCMCSNKHHVNNSEQI